MRKLALPLAAGAALLVAYLPALTDVYGFREDFGLLFRGMIGNPTFPGNIFMDGRPLYALGFWLLFPVATGVASLVWLRLAGIVGIALFLFVFARLMERSGIARPVAWATVALLGLTPPFLLTAGWASLYEVPYACLFGVLSGHCCWRAVETRHRRWAAASLGLLLLSLLTYQAGAMCFWLAILLGAYASPPSRPLVLRLILCAVVLFGTCWLYGKGLGWVATHLYADHPIAPYKTFRMGRTFAGLGDNLRWFAEYSLPTALNLVVFPPRAWAGWTLGTLLALLICLRGGGASRIAWRLALVATGIPILYAPCLVSVGCEGYRTQIALQSGLVLAFALALPRTAPKTVMAGALTGILALAVMQHHALKTYLITPVQKEMADLSARMGDARPTEDARLILVRPPLEASYGANIGEFGNASGSRFYAALGMAYFHLWERFPDMRYGPDVPFIDSESVRYGPVWSLSLGSFERLKATGVLRPTDRIAAFGPTSVPASAPCCGSSSPGAAATPPPPRTSR